MRKTVLVVCASLLAGTLGAQESRSGGVQNATDGNLRVAVLPPAPKMHEPLRYQLTEPAYVAAFVVYPGSGVRLLYPLINTPEQLQSAGYHSDQLIGKSFDDDFYNVVLGPRVAGPAYLYVIASRHPLGVAQYVHRPARLASSVGEASARSFYTDVAFDGIVKNAISLGDDQSWDADVYTLWPPSETERNLAKRETPRMKLVVCANGTTLSVPENYVFLGCPGDAKLRPVTPPKAATRTLASAQISAPISAPGLTGGGSTLARPDSSTVLPTIVGKRLQAPDRGPAAGQAGVLTYTEANGAPSMPAGDKVTYSRNVAPGIQLEVMDRSAADRRDMRLHARPTADRGEPGQVVGGNPQLSPNPQLAPNPQLSPAPNVGTPAASPPPARSAAARTIGEQRHVTEEPVHTPRSRSAAAPPASVPSHPAKVDHAPRP